MSDRPPIYYGLCEGGPFHGKHLAEARTVSPVAYDKKTLKYQGPLVATKDPNIAFGEYMFEGKTWIWHPAEIRSASKTASPAESGS